MYVEYGVRLLLGLVAMIVAYVMAIKLIMIFVELHRSAGTTTDGRPAAEDRR